MKDRSRVWDGGYIRTDSKGRDTYIIRRRVAGTLYEVSTRCHTSGAAHKQLQRFEADPGSYSPGVGAGGAGEQKPPIYLNEALRRDYRVYFIAGKRNSKTWTRKCFGRENPKPGKPLKGYVNWWAQKLKGVDLRRATLRDHILPPLDGATCRAHRIAVLKGVYTWLREEKHEIKAAEDPTFGALTVPQAEPAQWKRTKAFTHEHYLKARQHLIGHWRDALDLQAGTGWHVTEAQRFAKYGSIEPHPHPDENVTAVLVCPQTKGGELARTPVSAEVTRAAERLLARGTLSIEKYRKAVKAACGAAGIPVFTPGSSRHSVATWAINNGADPASVAAFLNHKSPRTTKKFYATHATPKKVPTLL